MTEPFWVELAKAVQAWATASAIVVGGAWAYYRFVLRRENETAVGIDEIAISSVPYAGECQLVAFDVTLANKASVRVTAKPNRTPAFKDAREVLAYSGDLMIRPVAQGLAPGTQAGWFAAAPAKNPAPSDIEIDLLSDYAVDGSDGASRTDFWMEPGETYHIGAAVVLAPGPYLGMVTFIGSTGDYEFWRRSFVFSVPVTAERQGGARMSNRGDR